MVFQGEKRYSKVEEALQEHQKSHRLSHELKINCQPVACMTSKSGVSPSIVCVPELSVHSGPSVHSAQRRRHNTQSVSQISLS